MEAGVCMMILCGGGEAERDTRQADSSVERTIVAGRAGAAPIHREGVRRDRPSRSTRKQYTKTEEMTLRKKDGNKGRSREAALAPANDPGRGSGGP